MIWRGLYKIHYGYKEICLRLLSLSVLTCLPGDTFDLIADCCPTMTSLLHLKSYSRRILDLLGAMNILKYSSTAQIFSDNNYLGIMNQFSNSGVPYGVRKLAALAQVLIIFGSPSAQSTRLRKLSTLSSSPE